MEEGLEFWALVLGCVNAAAALYIWTRQRRLTQAQVTLQTAQTELQRDQTDMQRVQTDLQAVQTALQERANELAEAQDALARKQIESMREADAARSKARLDFWCVRTGKTAHLRIENTGGGVAITIRLKCLSFSDNVDPLDSEDVEELLQEEVLPGRTHEVPITVFLSMVQDDFEVTWTNPDGTVDQRKKTIRY